MNPDSTATVMDTVYRTTFISDTIYQRHIVLDTAKIASADIVDLYKEINTVQYNDLYYFLIGFIAIATVLLGTQFLWNKIGANRYIQKEVEKRSKNHIETMKEESFEMINKKFIAQSKDMETKLSNTRNNVEGGLFHIQANSETVPKQKLISLILSAQFYLRGEDYENMRAVIGMIPEQFKKIEYKDLGDMKIDRGDIAELLDDLVSADKNGECTDLIKMLKREIKLLKDKVTEPSKD